MQNYVYFLIGVAFVKLPLILNRHILRCGSRMSDVRHNLSQTPVEE